MSAQSLEDAGALEYTTIVAAPASDSAGFKWLAPYTGSAIGQHWMYAGKHVLIIFDDLSKQAEAYRAISLLLRRPPGREAYPGDVFYLHSRLLERCAKLSDELGAGSMTGLPIIETKANDVSAYIPTNVISITDGQCFLESDLFNSGVRPAINVGISVSRVGGAAQVKAMRTVSGTLRLDLSPYRELEAFAAFGSDLDAVSAAALGRGTRLVELLKQPQYSPFPVEEQVVSIWVGTSGQLDDVPVEDIGKFESEFLEYLRRNEEGALAEIRDTGKLTDENVERLERVVKEFKRSFTTSAGESWAAKLRSTRWTRTTSTRRPSRSARRTEEMAAQIRVLRRRIRSTQSTKKITSAMEMIATSRIVKAQARVQESRPYAEQITEVLTELASDAALDHPLLVETGEPAARRGAGDHERPRPVRRLQQQRAQRGRGARLAAARAGQGAGHLRDRAQGRELLPVPQPRGAGVVDRLLRAAHLRRTRPRRRAALVEAFMADDGRREQRRRAAPGVHAVRDHGHADAAGAADGADGGRVRREGRIPFRGDPTALRVRADPDALLDAMLPKYIGARLFSALLESAASESADRQRAMKAATDNANELIRNLTLEANQARQAQITQEISEIVGGADALVTTGSD